MQAGPDRLYGGDVALSRRARTTGLWTAVALTLVALVGLWAPGVQAQNAAREIRIPFPQDDGSLTPYTFKVGYPLVTLVYDTLMSRGAGGAPQQWLTRSLRKGDAGKQITIRLRKGIRWHDGKPLTAEDVAFTFGYFARRFHPRFTPQLEAVERVQALNAETVRFTLRHPSPGFEDQPLSDVPILPRHLWQGLPAGQLAPKGLAVGSGPYRLVRHRRGKDYRFQANRGYFRGRPKVDTIEVPFIGNFDGTVRALESRRVDVIPVTLTEKAQDQLRRSVFKTSFGPLYTGTTLMFNLRRRPFDKPAARRAVARALDLKRIAQTGGGGGQSEATPADNGYLHPQSGWASPIRLHRFDEDRARAELKALDLPRIRVAAPDNDPVKLEAGRQVVLALERAGARAVLRKLPPDRLAAAVGQDGSKPTFEAAIWTSPALASYEPDFLRAVFGSRMRAPLNYSSYRSGAFDRLAARAAAATNPETRRRTVYQELKLLARDVPVVPLFFQKGAFAYRPQVYNGWVFVRGTGILDKRSFLRSVIGPSSGSSDPIVRDDERAAGGGIGVLGIVALGLLGVVLVILALGLAGRLARRRRA